MRVLICGSRTYSDDHDVMSYLFEGLERALPFNTIIHGGATGADRLADELAKDYSGLVWEFPADWDKHGKAAVPIRNQQMLVNGEPDLVIAFVDKPLEESKGTADMVRRATQAGVPTYVVERVS